MSDLKQKVANIWPALKDGSITIDWNGEKIPISYEIVTNFEKNAKIVNDASRGFSDHHEVIDLKITEIHIKVSFNYTRYFPSMNGIIVYAGFDNAVTKFYKSLHRKFGKYKIKPSFAQTARIDYY